MNENKTMISRSTNDTQSIDIVSVVQDVAKEWLSIFLLTISAVLLSYIILTNFRDLYYATSVTMVINNGDENEEAKSSSASDVYENLYYGAEGASRLSSIFESDALKKTVANDLGLKKFDGSISAQTIGDSNLLKITVRSTSPYMSFKEAESILKNYESFSKDLIGGTNLTILERAKIPERLEHPRQNLRYSFYIGVLTLAAVCSALALMSIMRDTVHNSTDVEKKVDAKLLSTIMHEKKHHRGKQRVGGEKASILITDPVTSFQYAEEMRKLAARVLNEMTENQQKVLLISSAAENEGKSTISANMALAMSQINKNVVLVDMDFRKPSLYKILNLQESGFVELSECIKGKEEKTEADIEKSVDSLLYKVPGTDLLTILNRKAISQAVEKHSGFIEKLIEELKNKAEFIIIDTAPISLVSDAEELAGMADTSIIVVRQHWIEAREINDTIDALGGRERMLGCVFNNARRNSMSGANAGYSYGYGYGYGGHYAR